MTSFLFFLFSLSRLFFITTQAVFFDSAEYLDRLKDPSFFQALISGHIPLHSGYVILFWPVYHLGTLLGVDPVFFTLVFQVFLAFVTLVLLYKSLSVLTESAEISLVSVVLFSLTPVFWITNVTVMMETAYLFFFAGALYFLVKRSLLRFLFFWSLAILTHPLLVLWVPFLLAVGWQNQQKKKFWLTGLAVAGGFLLGSFINIFLICAQLHAHFGVGFSYLFGSKLNEQTLFDGTLRSALMFLRNFLIPLLRNNTPILLLCAAIGSIIILKKNKKLFVVLFLLVVPALIVNQIWDSLFLGRHALIAGLGIAVFAAYALRNKCLLAVVCIYLLIVSGYAISLLRQPIPYLEEAQMVVQLPAGGLLIESHFARPQTQRLCQGETVFVNEPFWPQLDLSDKIKYYLSQNKPVFVSGAALSEPYGLYAGPYPQVLTLSYAKSYQLQSTMENFTLQPFKILSQKDNVQIFQVVSAQAHEYPAIPQLNCSERRIDYGDVVTRIWLWLGIFTHCS